MLVVGGVGASGILSSAELFNPATNPMATTGSLAVARVFHTATLLADGKVSLAVAPRSHS